MAPAKRVHQLIDSSAVGEARPSRLVVGRHAQERRAKPQVAARPMAEGDLLPVSVRLEPDTPALVPQDIGRLMGAPTDAIDFLAESVDLRSPDTWILENSTVPALKPDAAAPRSVIGGPRINDIRGINRFFMRVNRRLRAGGLFAVRVRTLEDDRRAPSFSV